MEVPLWIIFVDVLLVLYLVARNIRLHEAIRRLRRTLGELEGTVPEATKDEDAELGG